MDTITRSCGTTAATAARFEFPDNTRFLRIVAAPSPLQLAINDVGTLGQRVTGWTYVRGKDQDAIRKIDVFGPLGGGSVTISYGTADEWEENSQGQLQTITSAQSSFNLNNASVPFAGALSYLQGSDFTTFEPERAQWPPAEIQGSTLRAVGYSKHTDAINTSHRGLIVLLNVTGVTAPAALTLTLSAMYGAVAFPLETLAAGITATGVYNYVVYPGVSGSAAKFNNTLPRAFRLTEAVSGATGNITYNWAYASLR